MIEIKEINEETFKNLMNIPQRFWSKSRFNTTLTCETLVNNKPEAFDAVSVKNRAKPIVIMIEEIKVYIMLRWESNTHKISKYKGQILPNIKKKIA